MYSAVSSVFTICVFTECKCIHTDIQLMDCMDVCACSHMCVVKCVTQALMSSDGSDLAYSLA